jgi:hypothetical protein
MARNGYQLFDTQGGRKIKKRVLVMIALVIASPFLLGIVVVLARGGVLHLDFWNWLCVAAASYLIWRRY